MILAQDVILASGSPRRRDLLEAMIGDTFRVIASGVDELEEGFLPEPILKNAERKAIAIADREQSAFVIGADTGIILDNELIGKPDNALHAHEILRKLSGKTHMVFTGVSIIMRSRDIQTLFSDISYVTFKTLDDATIEKYLQLAEPYDMAGAYGIQDHGEMLIEKIKGSYSNVVGLPVEKLYEVFKLHGIKLLDAQK